MLTRAASAKAAEEWPYTVALVPLKYLFVDERYQRPRLETFIRRSAAQFDPDLVGVLDVAPRGERFAVLDGQQRLGMMEIVGKTACWCAVYGQMTLREESDFFWKKNDRRKNMKPYYKFRARVVAEEPKAVRILGVVHGCGFDVGEKPNDSDTIAAIRALEDSYGYTGEHRDESLTPALITIREGIYGYPKSTDGEIIRGLGRFWSLFSDEEVDMARLAQSLAGVGAPAILGQARDHMYLQGGHTKGWQIARVILTEYNKVSRRGRLDASRLA